MTVHDYYSSRPIVNVNQVYPWLTSVSIVFIFTLLCDASIVALLGTRSQLMLSLTAVYEGNLILKQNPKVGQKASHNT